MHWASEYTVTKLLFVTIWKTSVSKFHQWGVESCLFELHILFLNILIMLLPLSQFSTVTHRTQHPLLPHTIVHVHRSCIYVLWLLYFLCCTLHPHNYSVTSYSVSLLHPRITSELAQDGSEFHPKQHLSEDQQLPATQTVNITSNGNVVSVFISTLKSTAHTCK